MTHHRPWKQTGLRGGRDSRRRPWGPPATATRRVFASDAVGPSLSRMIRAHAGSGSAEIASKKLVCGCADYSVLLTSVAGWFLSVNSVRGPMERLGIISVPERVSPFSSAHWKRTSGSQEICRSLLISSEITGLAQNPLHACFRPKQAAQDSQEIALRVAMALRDSCTTR